MSPLRLSPLRLSPLRLLLVWTRAQNRIFWRTPIGAFFTLVFPVLMIVLFSAVFGNETFPTAYGDVTASQFYVVGLAAYSSVSATYTNVTMTLCSRRDLGILKRVRGTPLPPWVYLGSVVLSSVWIAVLGTSIMLALGVTAYGVTIEAAKAPALVMSFLIGSAVFSVLGLGLASLARTVAAAIPAANATLLPLAFVSDIFIPLGDDAPRWLAVVGDMFPLKHYAHALGESLSPFSSAPAWQWGSYAAMLVWAVVGALVAVRWFSWDAPVKSGRRARRRTRSRASR